MTTNSSPFRRSLFTSAATISDYFLEQPASSGPCRCVELDHGAGFFPASSSIEAVSITGLFGFSDDAVPAPIALVERDRCGSADGGRVELGRGRCRVSPAVRDEAADRDERAMVDQADALNPSATSTTRWLLVTDGTKFSADEVIDSERMSITDVVDNVLLVRRDSSVLADHASGGTTIYAARSWSHGMVGRRPLLIRTGPL